MDKIDLKLPLELVQELKENSYRLYESTKKIKEQYVNSLPGYLQDKNYIDLVDKQIKVFQIYFQECEFALHLHRLTRNNSN